MSISFKKIIMNDLRTKMFYSNWLVSAFFIFSMVLTGCGEEQLEKTQNLRNVKYLQVKTNTEGQSRVFSGLAKGQEEVDLSFKLAGTVSALPVKVGDQLKKNQVIAQLDPIQFELQAQQAHATLAQALASMRNASATFERLKGLYENNNASQNELDSARASAEFSQAQVKAARKGLELAQLNLSYTRLRSTNNCEVAQTYVDTHENVGSGQSIAKVSCGRAMDVEIGIPARYVATVNKGMVANVIFSALPDKKFSGLVSEVGGVSTSGGATFPVKVELKNSNNDIRSGMSAEVTLKFAQQVAENHIIVPAIAVIEEGDSRYVYVLENTQTDNINKIKKLSVTIGELTANGIEITSGLKTGDRVVTAGVSVIRDGLEVRAGQ